MDSRWDEKAAQALGNDLLALRVYTSRLLGCEPDLVLHGGGNTSVKAQGQNVFGETETVLWVKGSGSDLAQATASDFTAVNLETLCRAAELPALSDREMVRLQRGAMLDPNAPSPSVEAILHAIIPRRFVDHTHADAVVTLTNTPGGEDRIRQLYGSRVLIIPYVMPGFALAQAVRRLTRNANWSVWEGIVLMHHGLITFSDDARASYERTLAWVSAAEEVLRTQAAYPSSCQAPEPLTETDLARIRKNVSDVRHAPVIALWEHDSESVAFSCHAQAESWLGRGPLTPDHSIRTKRIPVFLDQNHDLAIRRFAEAYQAYVDRYATAGMTPLQPAPNWAMWRGYGRMAFGTSVKEARIISDIASHTLRAIRHAEVLGGWSPVGEQDAFAVEYWELEQAKLKHRGPSLPHQGQIALVTGAARGIGQATVAALLEQGAVVAALDYAPEIAELWSQPEVLALCCDVRSRSSVLQAVQAIVRRFGGLDIVISNAGIFPPSEPVEQISPEHWDASLAVNLTGHYHVIQACIPYLALGWEPAMVVIASKNVPAPGPGAAAYSAAKAGLTQLARVLALELGPQNIRVNVLHPHGVFDTALWTPEILAQRAQHYGKSVEEYKRNNLLHTEVTARNVAQLACALAGPLFGKTTGAQIPIDGGNERVI